MGLVRAAPWIRRSSRRMTAGKEGIVAYMTIRAGCGEDAGSSPRHFERQLG
jgi:hypothetical protein